MDISTLVNAMKLPKKAFFVSSIICGGLLFLREDIRAEKRKLKN